MAETQAPKFIYLQDGGNLEPLRADQYNEQVTWCEVSVEDNDTKYVRADLHEELERQLVKAQKEARAFYALSEERMNIIEATRSQLATARQELKTAQKYIRVHMPYPPDYACVDCAPRSEILIKDFQCAYHKSIRALEGQT